VLFKQYDSKQSGYVTIKSFDDVLKQARCVLDKNEIYTLSRILDKDKSGLVNYTKFISEIVKP
jgi:Ca2+-binding EF-hand superfamily protein